MGGLGHEALECETCSVDRRVGRGPAGDDHTNDASPSERVPCEEAGIGLNLAGGIQSFIGIGGDQGSEEEGCTDPGDVVAKKHADGWSPAGRLVFGETENGKIRHAKVHGRVTQPGKNDDLAETEIDGTVGQLHIFDTVVPNRIELGKGMGIHLGQRHDTTSHEDENHPRCGNVGEAGNHVVAAGRDQGDQRTHNGHDQSEASSTETKGCLRHLEAHIKGHAHGRS